MCSSFSVQVWETLSKICTSPLSPEVACPVGQSTFLYCGVATLIGMIPAKFSREK